MANPVVIECPVDVWTKIATSVMTGGIHKLLFTSGKYLQTYRETGDPAPTDNEDAAELFETDSTFEAISSAIFIDVYVKPVSAAGKVRVDL